MKVTCLLPIHNWLKRSPSSKYQYLYHVPCMNLTFFTTQSKTRTDVFFTSLLEPFWESDYEFLNSLCRPSMGTQRSYVWALNFANSKYKTVLKLGCRWRNYILYRVPTYHHISFSIKQLLSRPTVGREILSYSVCPHITTTHSIWNRPPTKDLLLKNSVSIKTLTKSFTWLKCRDTWFAWIPSSRS